MSSHRRRRALRRLQPERQLPSSSQGLGTDGEAAVRGLQGGLRDVLRDGLHDGLRRLHLPAQSRRSEPFGRARAACFERLAGVYASRVAVFPILSSYVLNLMCKFSITCVLWTTLSATEPKVWPECRFCGRYSGESSCFLPQTRQKVLNIGFVVFFSCLFTCLSLLETVVGYRKKYTDNVVLKSLLSYVFWVNYIVNKSNVFQLKVTLKTLDLLTI